MFVGGGPLKNYIQEKGKELAFQPDSILFVGKIPHSNGCSGAQIGYHLEYTT